MIRTVRVPALIVGILLASVVPKWARPMEAAETMRRRSWWRPNRILAPVTFEVPPFDWCSTSSFSCRTPAGRSLSPPLPQSPQSAGPRAGSPCGTRGAIVARPDLCHPVRQCSPGPEEANVAAGLTHVFSTGAVLDSGRVAGRVLDAWTANPAEGARVLLYRDSLPVSALEVNAPDSVRCRLRGDGRRQRSF